MTDNGGLTHQTPPVGEGRKKENKSKITPSPDPSKGGGNSPKNPVNL